MGPIRQASYAGARKSAPRCRSHEWRYVSEAEGPIGAVLTFVCAKCLRLGNILAWDHRRGYEVQAAKQAPDLRGPVPADSPWWECAERALEVAQT